MPRFARWIVPVALIGLVLYFTSAGKHAAVIWEEFVKKIDEQIPIRHHIAVLKRDVQKLDKDIDAKKTEVAACRVAEAEAREEMDAARVTVEESEVQLKVIARDIDKPKVSAASDAVARQKQKFAAKYEAFQAAEVRLSEKEKKHAGAKANLKQATDELDALRLAKQALEREVADLESQLRAVELAETRARSPHGDTRVSEAQRTAAELRKKLAVRAERVKVDTDPVAPPPVTSADADSALKQWKARQAAKE